MEIYRLPGNKIAQSATGPDPFPDVLIVGDSMLRQFTVTTPGRFPIAFRSDTRKPSEIYQVGFQRKQLVVDYLDKEYGTETPKRKRLGAARADIEVRASLAGTNVEAIKAEIAKNINELERISLAMRVNTADIDVETGVCFSLDFRVASLFPYDGTRPEEVFAVPTTIYATRLRSWLETYRIQELVAPKLAYSQEVATLAVPPVDILAALTVNRTYHKESNTVEVSVSKVSFQDFGSDLLGAPDLPAGHDVDVKFVTDLAEKYRKPVTVALPKQKDAEDAMNIDQKVQRMIAGIKAYAGTPARNSIAFGNTPQDLSKTAVTSTTTARRLSS